jgi:hypothetical protein
MTSEPQLRILFRWSAIRFDFHTASRVSSALISVPGIEYRKGRVSITGSERRIKIAFERSNYERDRFFAGFSRGDGWPCRLDGPCIRKRR